MHLHRHRFDSVRRASNFVATHVFDDVSSISGLAPVVCRMLSPKNCAALRGASAATKSLVPATSRDLYVVGGSNSNTFMTALNSLDRFNPVSETWQALAPMSTGRHYHAASVISGNLYVVGGRSPQGLVLDSVEKFNPASGTWQSLAPMSTGRECHSASVISGHLYVVGGQNEQRGSLNSAERYDPESGTWQALAPMSTRRSDHSGSVISGHLYIVGGLDEQSVLNSMDEFTPESGTWHSLAPMSTARAIHSSSVISGHLYVVGGTSTITNEEMVMLNSVERFLPELGVWQSLTKMSQSRCFHSSSVIDGNLFVLGGITVEVTQGTSINRLSNSVQRFDPEAGTWQSTTPMSAALIGHTASVIHYMQ